MRYNNKIQKQIKGEDIVKYTKSTKNKMVEMS